MALFINAPKEARCQISLSAFQISYNENFNTLSVSGVYNTAVPFGWYFLEIGSNKNIYYTAGDGSTGGGNTYSFGKVGSTERAFGTIRSGTVHSIIGAKFINNTGGVITRLLITYKGECWRIGALRNSADRMDFKYSSDATSLNNGNWIDHDELDFEGPAGLPTGALDGNAPENIKIISSEITGLNISPGANFWIKFDDWDADNSDDGLAIDDFNITPSDTCITVIDSFMPAEGPVNTAVTIVGKNMTGTSKVMFCGKESSFTIIDDSTMKAIVPEGATTGRISCINGCFEISKSDFKVLGSNCNKSSGLIISELCDPLHDYGTDRFIEIYNPTTSVINLDGWSVRAIANNAPDTTCGSIVMCWNLHGSINPGQALTCGYDKALHVTHDFTSPEWNVTSSTNGTCYYWNGQWRDGAALYQGKVKVDGILRDNLEKYWYNDRSIVRKSSICSGTPSSSYLDWEVFDSVSYANLLPATPHSHYTDCNKEDLPLIIQHPRSLIVCEEEAAIIEVGITMGIPPYSYKWMVQDSSSWKQVINDSRYSGEESGTLVINRVTPELSGLQFYCVITNGDGDCYVSSNAFQLAVNKRPQGNIIKHL